MADDKDVPAKAPPGRAPARRIQAKRPQVISRGRRAEDVYRAAGGPTSEPRQVDICFVFDTTGSMSGKLDGLVNCMAEFVGELARLGLDWRVSAVPFGDLTIAGDRVVGDLGFVSTREAAQRMLRTLPRFHGGGNEGESSLEAVQVACRKPYRLGAVKVLVVLTDEPPHETPLLTSAHVGETIIEGEFICFVAAPDPKIQGSRVEGFRRWALDNGGAWYPIGQTMETDKILKLLRSLVLDIPRVADRVHELGGGSVRRYLELGEGMGRG